MIKGIHEKDIAECVNAIKESFLTVADELGYTLDNAPRFTAFAITEDRLLYQYQNEHRLMFAYYDDNKIIGYYSLSLKDDNECELILQNRIHLNRIIIIISIVNLFPQSKSIQSRIIFNIRYLHPQMVEYYNFQKLRSLCSSGETGNQTVALISMFLLLRFPLTISVTEVKGIISISICHIFTDNKTLY